MRNQRKVLIRNLVLALVVADFAGVYYAYNHLTKPAPSEGVAIDDEMIAAAAKVDFRPQSAQPEAAAEPVLAARELPKPAFGQDAAKLAVAEPKAAPAPVAAKPAAVPAPAAAPAAKPKPAPALAAAPAAAKVAAAPAAARVTAPRIVIAPRPAAAPRAPALAAAPVKKAVTLSVIPAAPSKAKALSVPSTRLAKAEAPVRKRAAFKKAFSSMAKAAPETSLIATSGSLAISPATPAITAQFSPETQAPVPASMGLTTQAMTIGQAGTAPDTALPKELGGTPVPTTASTELPPLEEE